MFSGWVYEGSEVLGDTVITTRFEALPRAFVADGIGYELLSDGALAVTGCDSGIKTIVIPESVSYAGSTCSVGTIGEGAFDGCAVLDENGSAAEFSADTMAGHKYTADSEGNLAVHVPKVNGFIREDGLLYRITSNSGSKEVVLKGFDGDSSTEELVVPASVSYLGFEWAVAEVASKAFMGNTDIVYLNCSVDVGFKAFARCTSLEEVVAFGSISSYSFHGCASLIEASFEGDASKIGVSAFSGCSSLSYTNIESVKVVGKHAFYGCFSMRDADLSATTRIGYGALTGTNLYSVLFSGDLSKVDAKAFFRYRFYDEDGARLSVSAEDLAGKEFVGERKVMKRGNAC